MRKINKILTEAILVLIVLVIVIVFSFIKDKHDISLKSNYNIAKGQIEKYYSGGVDLSAMIKYKYKVNNVLYYRNIKVNYKFDICKDFNNCRDKRYWVIYSPDNPENSLINLEIEIQNSDNPVFPENLDDFK